MDQCYAWWVAPFLASKAINCLTKSLFGKRVRSSGTTLARYRLRTPRRCTLAFDKAVWSHLRSPRMHPRASGLVTVANGNDRNRGMFPATGRLCVLRQTAANHETITPERPVIVPCSIVWDASLEGASSG